MLEIDLCMLHRSLQAQLATAVLYLDTGKKTSPHQCHTLKKRLSRKPRLARTGLRGPDAPRGEGPPPKILLMVRTMV